ncbi:hypothetical protein SDC9_176245 [bioreactor metagenome]|uniref:Uncharacterized protein n=1 Tax=bioreactor metagenome TaxID=1076179 RepID=A0A645GRC6_9ZZZZ
MAALYVQIQRRISEHDPPADARVAVFAPYLVNGLLQIVTLQPFGILRQKRELRCLISLGES